MWIARYLLLRLCESYGVDVNFHLQAARRGRRLERLGHAHELLDEVHARGRRQGVLRGADGGVRRRHRTTHIAVYGADNHLRLTGLHETQSIDTFSFGVADRGASIRVPHSFVQNGYRGYLEDRRPNSQARSVPGHRADRRDDRRGHASRAERRGARGSGGGRRGGLRPRATGAGRLAPAPVADNRPVGVCESEAFAVRADGSRPRAFGTAQAGNAASVSEMPAQGSVGVDSRSHRSRPEGVLRS